MSLPLPIDPYIVLGVAKDADVSTIRSNHRRLVLKYHPDRLKGEAEQAKGKDTFQKIQEAYELLSDPTERLRYDNRVKVAQLKKEAAAARDPPPRTTSYPVRAPPPSTPTREYRDGRIYEERGPSRSYFEEGYRYREEEPRTTSRKYNGYERERKSEFGQREKERKSTKWPEKAANDLPFNIAPKFKAKAQKTGEKINEKTREKETHAASARSKHQTQRKERMDKPSGRRRYIEDDSSSDSDIATYVTTKKPPPRPPKPSYDSPPCTKSKPAPTRRPTSRREEEDGDEEDRWHKLHCSAREYIERNQRRSSDVRPAVARRSTPPPLPTVKRTETRYSESHESRGRGL
jgi:curved DNA-binding protein CbpA